MSSRARLLVPALLAALGGSSLQSAAAASTTEPLALTHAAALAIVEKHGYDDSNSAAADHWRGRGLNVIVAIRTGSADGYTQHAFFFYGRRYLGTDAPDPSAGIAARRAISDTITLTYHLYRPNDPMVDPTGGHAAVRFRWNGTRLVRLDPLPSSSPKAPISRL